MPYDDMSIGPAPCNERCVQVGEEHYIERAREESRRFIELIRKKLGPEPEGALLRVKSNPHEFGTYLDVVCGYEEGNEEAEAYAYLCESEAPQTWQDDQPLQKKRYQVTCYPDATVTVEVEAESAHMAQIRGSAVVRERFRAASIALDGGPLDASAREVKEEAHAQPQN